MAMLSGASGCIDAATGSGPAGAGGGIAPAGRSTSASSERLGASFVTLVLSRMDSSVWTSALRPRLTATATPSISAAAPTTIQIGSKPLAFAPAPRLAAAVPAGRAGAIPDSASETVGPRRPWPLPALRPRESRARAVARSSPRAEALPMLTAPRLERPRATASSVWRDSPRAEPFGAMPASADGVDATPPLLPSTGRADPSGPGLEPASGRSTTGVSGAEPTGTSTG